MGLTTRGQCRKCGRTTTLLGGSFTCESCYVGVQKLALLKYTWDALPSVYRLDALKHVTRGYLAWTVGVILLTLLLAGVLIVVCTRV